MEYERVLPHILDRIPASQAVAGIGRIRSVHAGHRYRILPLIALRIDYKNLARCGIFPADILTRSAAPASQVFCQMKDCICAGFQYVRILPVCLVIDRSDGASRNNIVELVQQDNIPSSFYDITGICQALKLCHDSQCLQLLIHLLAFPVIAFVLSHGGQCSPVVLKIKFPIPYRHTWLGRNAAVNPVKKGPFTFLDQPGDTRKTVLKTLCLLQHFPGWTASAVSESKEH